MLIIVLAAIVWYLIGVASFVYWWTKDHNFTLRELPMALCCGLMGIVAFVMGWAIHGEDIIENIIVFHKRK